MNLYLFELSGRTLLGFVNLKDLTQFDPKKDLEEMIGIEDMEYVTVYNPAILSMSVVPLPANIQVPNQPAQMTVAPTLMPYYIGEMVLFVGNIMAVAEIPEQHYLREEMKRIVSHFRQIQKEEKKFTPKVVQ